MDDLIKTPAEIEIMREGGKILAEMLIELQAILRPGLDTWEIETRFIEMCTRHNVEPACKGYSPYGFPPYPTGICVSINKEVVHGIPKKGKVIKDGDLVTLDTVIKHKGLYLDHAVSVVVGKTTSSRNKMLKVCKKALDESINLVKEGAKVGEISATIQKIAEDAGYTVSRDYVGHGIGKEMHEDPQIPCFGNKYQGPVLKAGMTICIEPLIAEGTNKVRHNSFWDVETLDGKDFVQMEHTVLVTEDGHEILTLL